MESNNKHIDDLSEIRSMMEKASKFISLSGLAGVGAGICALLGAAVAYCFLYIYYPTATEPYLFKTMDKLQDGVLFMLILASIILLLASLTAIFFTIRNTRKKKIPLWDHKSKKFFINLIIPFSVGAIFVLALLYNGAFQLVVPASIIFYGLTLLNAGQQYTFRDIISLSYLQLVIGCISLFLPKYHLLIWTICFGLLHIIYGILMYYKYDKEKSEASE